MRKGEGNYFSFLLPKKLSRTPLNCVSPSAQNTQVALDEEKWLSATVVLLGRTSVLPAAQALLCDPSPFCFHNVATPCFLLNCFIYITEKSLFSPKSAQFRWTTFLLFADQCSLVLNLHSAAVRSEGRLPIAASDVAFCSNLGMQCVLVF